MAAEAEDPPRPSLEGPVTPQRKHEDAETAEQARTTRRDASNESGDESEGEDDDGGEDDEPKLKYHRLTPSLSSLYRGGDATSAFIVSGDKMVTIRFWFENQSANQLSRSSERIMETS
jgi:hypothetical protein